MYFCFFKYKQPEIVQTRPIAYLVSRVAFCFEGFWQTNKFELVHILFKFCYFVFAHCWINGIAKFTRHINSTYHVSATQNSAGMRLKMQMGLCKARHNRVKFVKIICACCGFVCACVKGSGCRQRTMGACILRHRIQTVFAQTIYIQVKRSHHDLQMWSCRRAEVTQV